MRIETIQNKTNFIPLIKRDILSYGNDNLYPQNIKLLTRYSVTAAACLKLKNNFVFGKGLNLQIYRAIINSNKNQRLDQLVRKIVNDLNQLGGFAIHISYKANLEFNNITYIPFEKARLGLPDDFGNSTYCYICDDWSDDKAEKIKYTFYTSDKDILARKIQNAGGIENYAGDIYYYGMNGEIEYPLSPFDSVYEDMVAEMQLSIFRNANTSNGFMASYIVQFMGSFNELAESNVTITADHPNYKYALNQAGDELFKKFQNQFKTIKGAQNTGNILLIENNLQKRDGTPLELKFEKVETPNFDKTFEVTERSAENAIIKAAGVVPDLILQKNTGFATDTIIQAYNYMNEKTEFERLIIEEFLTDIISQKLPFNDYQIIKKSYINEQSNNNI